MVVIAVSADGTVVCFYSPVRSEENKSKMFNEEALEMAERCEDMGVGGSRDIIYPL